MRLIDKDDVRNPASFYDWSKYRNSVKDGLIIDWQNTLELMILKVWRAVQNAVDAR